MCSANISGGSPSKPPATRPTEITITTCDEDCENEGNESDGPPPLSPEDPAVKVLLEVKSPDITPGTGTRCLVTWRKTAGLKKAD